MSVVYDYVIFGAGFGGSITAMILRRLGFSVLLLEKGRHPRFAIGESSTPFANLLLEQIAREFDLPFLRSLAEWGSWQRDFPQLGCGLKRGFTFYHHTRGCELDLGNREQQLLVAASPNDSVADTHWYRPDFDRFLAGKAVELGVDYIEEARFEISDGIAEWDVQVTSPRRTFRARAPFAIDATGAAGVLAKQVGAERIEFPFLPVMRGVYGHFRDVRRLPDPPGAPYPAEDAAVHHVVSEGWAWVLRFNNGITSIGAALARSDRDISAGETWRWLQEDYPSLRRLFKRATPVTPLDQTDRLSFRRTKAAGRHWALLPATAGFVDPLLSTGFALNLHGILRIGQALQRGEFDPVRYETETFAELDAAAELISAMYRKLDSFQEFSALSLLYFAAMSFTETAWRLGKSHLATRFLLANDPRFNGVRQRFCAQAIRGAPIDMGEIAAAIEPWDIAGLSDLSRRNHYPVRFEDLVHGRLKLEASADEIQALLTILTKDRAANG